ncbi:hypothetical protein NMQ03_08805 [Arthrobacter sp. DNA4]|uniref:hypothetical protein n=1 Tax=Arthrobacter sp. DNA4 TaxID=2963432 RepID=UPI0020CB8151|nr:hypothetical protein [Arthrobacter sp. DNA4]UTT71157.1 hypothetical protein NMQ03_08805 [Arthrobacter sp. DNA4]
MKRGDVKEVLCGAVIGPINQPEYVVVGLPVDGSLQIVGRSAVQYKAHTSGSSP